MTHENYAIRLDTTHICTMYHQLRQCRQLMMQQKHHQCCQYRYKIHHHAHSTINYDNAVNS